METDLLITNSYVTSVRLDRAEVTIARALKIKLPSAFKLGLKILVDLEIEKGNKILDPSILNAWKNLREKEIEEISTFLSTEKQRHKTLSNILDRYKEEERKRNGNLIEVWDRGEEKYIKIPESSFDPQWHIRQTVSQRS